MQKKKRCSFPVISVFSVIIITGFISLFSLQAVQLQTPLQHEVNITLKLIQVYVTDKKGNPVLDLDRKDFVVFDNGIQRNITDFEKHLINLKSRKDPPDSASIAVETTPILRHLNRNFLLFIDFAFNTNKGILQAKQAALDFLDHYVLPTDEVGIISYSEFDGLKIREYFSLDHQRIGRAIKDLSVKAISGRAEDFENGYYNNDYMGSKPWATPENKQELKSQILNFLKRILDLAIGLRYVPGQKNIIMFSSGFPSSLINGDADANAVKTSVAGIAGSGDYVLRTRNRDMLKELNSANCRVFAFNSRNADMNVTDRSDNVTAGGSQGAFISKLDKAADGVNSLREISNETGGNYFGNINESKKGLDQLQALTGSFYVLGYPIDRKKDGKFREVKVEIKRKGCEVRTQSGYFNPKPFRDYSDLEKRLHLFDLALSEQPLFQTPSQFPLNALISPNNEKANLILISKIPVQIIEKFEKRKVELISIIFDEKDDIADLQRIETDLTRYRGMDVYLSFSSSLSAGNYKARVVVRDLDSGEAAVAFTTARILPQAPTSLALISPLLLIPEGNLVYFEKDYLKRNDRWPLAKAYPYDRAQYSPVIREVPKGTQKLFALLSCSCLSMEEPNFVYSGDCINAVSGESVPLDISIIKKSAKDSLDSQLIEFSISKLIPGKYYLYFHARDSLTQLSGFSQTQFIINP